MTAPEPLYAALRRQATYALTAFVCAALALEGLIPGSVLPMIDLVPLALLTAGLLFYDAVRRAHVHPLPWVSSALKLLCILALCGVLALTIPWSGRAGMAAAVILALGMVSLAFWPEK